MSEQVPFVDDMLAAVTKGDLREASALASRIRAELGSTEALITEVLGPVQREVGRRWETNEWNVAQEHLATGIIDATLADLALDVDIPPVHDDVVVTCAESEWHVVPARMLATMLESHGWTVTFLGASTPASHLQRFLAERPPAAVLVSASLSIHLSGARRTVAASHDVGIPVLAGGQAFGPDEKRAAAIGADAWAASADDARSILDEWSVQAPPLATPTTEEQTLPLAAIAPQIIDAALADLTRLMPRVAEFDEPAIERTREDFGYILEYARAAIDVRDLRIVDEFAPWIRRVLEARRVPPAVLGTSIRVLADAIPGEFGEVAGAIRRLGEVAGVDEPLHQPT